MVPQYMVGLFQSRISKFSPCKVSVNSVVLVWALAKLQNIRSPWVNVSVCYMYKSLLSLLKRLCVVCWVVNWNFVKLCFVRLMPSNSKAFASMLIEWWSLFRDVVWLFVEGYVNIDFFGVIFLYVPPDTSSPGGLYGVEWAVVCTMSSVKIKDVTRLSL